MRSVEAKVLGLNKSILLNLLIGCGRVLSLDDNFAVKCPTEDAPSHYGSICPGLSYFFDKFEATRDMSQGSPTIKIIGRRDCEMPRLIGPDSEEYSKYTLTVENGEYIFTFQNERYAAKLAYDGKDVDELCPDLVLLVEALNKFRVHPVSVESFVETMLDWCTVLNNEEFRLEREEHRQKGLENEFLHHVICKFLFYQCMLLRDQNVYVSETPNFLEEDAPVEYVLNVPMDAYDEFEYFEEPFRGEVQLHEV
eukprot:Gregarina_sp_Poly_1__283@NODE_106_length_14132_cov_144_167721_g93_i0_p6_GENE_NODE_106_length_14132_cov_144_167721_g93_i0NODE_106_length_14132_cov_144_167721_g93_i0_p6_ORF_typecomplete_len262_score40_23VPS28/PF03997_12/0_046_NODE_106_length_14132_cov_144_167721_g93_i031786